MKDKIEVLAELAAFVRWQMSIVESANHFGLLTVLLCVLCTGCGKQAESVTVKKKTDKYLVFKSVDKNSGCKGVAVAADDVAIAFMKRDCVGILEGRDKSVRWSESRHQRATCVSISGDGRYVAYASSGPPRIIRWDTSTSTEVAYRADHCMGVAVSRDGKSIVGVMTNSIHFPFEWFIKCWRCEGVAMKELWDGPKESGFLPSIAVTNDAGVFVFGDNAREFNLRGCQKTSKSKD